MAHFVAFVFAVVRAAMNFDVVVESVAGASIASVIGTMVANQTRFVCHPMVW